MRTRAGSDQAFDRFIEELGRLRLQAGLSPQALADRLGVEVDAVCRAEEGRRRIDVLELQRWAFACGSTLTEFMTRLERCAGRPASRLH